MSKRIDFLKGLEGMSASDLQAKIKEDEQRLKKLGFSHSISPLENPQSMRTLRRDIARMKTQLQKLQLG